MYFYASSTSQRSQFLLLFWNTHFTLIPKIRLGIYQEYSGALGRRVQKYVVSTACEVAHYPPPCPFPSLPLIFFTPSLHSLPSPSILVRSQKPTYIAAGPCGVARRPRAHTHTQMFLMLSFNCHISVQVSLFFGRRRGLATP